MGFRWSAAAVSLFGVAAWAQTGSGVVKDEARQVGAFHALRVQQGIEVEVTQGDKVSVVVRSDDNLLGAVKTEVQGGELEIRLAEHSQDFRSRVGLKVLVTAQHLDAAVSTAGARLKLTGLSGPTLALDASGGGQIEASRLSEGEVKVNASAGSRVRLAGTAKKLELEGSAGANLSAGELAAEAVQVTGSSGAREEVNASASVRGALSSGSRLEVHGTPAVREVAVSSGAHFELVGHTEL